MGILDDAIREHLDLKRKHGARDSELTDLEDEALGAGDRPDPFAASDLFDEGGSTATAEPESDQFPSGPETSPPPAMGDPGPGDDPTMLVEPESPMEPDSRPTPSGSPLAPEGAPLDPQSPPPGLELPDLPEPPGPPAAEPEAEAPASPDVELPPESASIEELMAEEEESEPPPPSPPPPDPAPPEAAQAPRVAPEPVEKAPEPVEEAPDAVEPVEPVEPAAPEEPPEALEPDAGVPEPPPPPPERGTEPPGRARGRVHVPTEEHSHDDLADHPEDFVEEPDAPPEPLDDDEPQAISVSDGPLEPEGAVEPEPEPEPAPAAAEDDQGGPELFDFETTEGSLEEPAERPPPAPVETGDDFEALGPAEEGAEYADEEEPYAEDTGGSADVLIDDDEDEVFETEVREPAPVEEDDEEEPDILSGSPEFVDEATDSEDLWFEKGPPQDFDFEDKA